MPAESDDATTRSVPEWLIPPPGGFTADEFLEMRGLPRHTELIDGSLVFVSPQRWWHVEMVDLLKRELRRQAPEGLNATREMSARLGRHQVPEPDVLVVKSEALNSRVTYFLPEHIVLAVEVVSPDSVERDRQTKPVKYAAARIRHFWRVEEDEGRAIVYVYELDPATGSYGLSGIHHDRLKVTAPFDIEIDLTEADRY
jgi:Uma2 family endonuclease